MPVDKLQCAADLTMRVSTEKTRDIGGSGHNPKNAMNIQGLTEWAIGTGADQANESWEDSRTLAGGVTENLDLQAGGETNAFGDALSFSVIKAIFINITSSAGGPLLIGGHATNALATLFGAANDKLRVRKTLLLATGDVTGYAVSAGDLLTIVNEDGADAVTFDIIVIGLD